MRIGELFAGYGGLGLGVVEVFAGEVAWVSEIDAGACKILEHRLPGVPNHGDITTIDWTEVEPVDVLTGGFPCQDVSAAGKRAGIRPGTRSGLWAWFAYAIDQLRPRLVVIENVRGILSAPAHSDLEPCPWCVGDHPTGALRASGAVLGDLADLGFDAEWVGLPAARVGAPHGRWREFFLAWPTTDAEGRGKPQWPGLDDARRALVSSGPRASAGDGPGDSAEGVHQLGGSAGLLPTPRSSDTNGAGAHGEGGVDLRTAVSYLPTPTARDHKGPNPNAREGGLDLPGALLPTPLASDAGPRGGTTGYGLRDWSRGLLPTPTLTDYKASGASQPRTPTHASGTTLTDATVRQPDQWGDYGPVIARWEQILARPAPAPTQPGATGNPQLAPPFVEWMMGLPAGWVTDVPGLSRNEKLRALGNGVVPRQAAAALRLLLARMETA